MTRDMPSLSILGRLAFWLALASLLALVGLVSSAQTESTEVSPFVIIVNADNPASSIDKDRLSRMFLKKIKRWADGGAAVEPFDQLENSEVCEAFTRAVHNKSLSAIKSYWQRLIFSGREVPPKALDSDAEMMLAVAGDEGGVGYVSSSTQLVDGVKTLEVTDD